MHHIVIVGGGAGGLELATRLGDTLGRRGRAQVTLVFAVGSGTNDFGTPGAREHAISLDTAEQAELFHRRLIDACIRANSQREPLRPEQLKVAIIGWGATGVELAAELHKTTRELIAYGLERIDPERDVRLTLIEAAPRILPALPERVAKAAEELLRALNVQVVSGERVTAVAADGVTTGGGRMPAELTVWAAGIKAPDFLREIDGLETNRINQLVVTPALQTTRDTQIFALGDCAQCPWPGHDRPVPPRAQAAHQQATHLARNLSRRLAARSLKTYSYRDFGSLVSLGDYSTVGSLMGKLLGGSIFIEGLFARFMCVSLYRMHLHALHGFAKVILDTLARLITRRTEPRVKLH